MAKQTWRQFVEKYAPKDPRERNEFARELHDLIFDLGQANNDLNDGARSASCLGRINDAQVEVLLS